MSAGVAPAALPEHLRERIRPVGDGTASSAGELVLYWMHHAVRAEDNPALDAARVAAHALGLPLLVYQGLGGRHPYDSDRHHAFILEGARDAAADLAVQGVRHVLHLPADPAAPSPLPGLAARAALVVTEDFPAPPFPAWTRRLARSLAAPVWRVDTACVLPMRLALRAYARAFEFRRAHGAEQLRRAALPWPDCEVRAAPFDGDVGFVPVDLARAGVAALCAACAIDHTVGPAPGTRGGTAAGLARWNAFLEHGLAGYARLRNDAAVEPPRGVSRMSPYLHHGHVSPLRVARDALAHGTGGAQKFLDELLVWRELAHNFCFHHEHLPGGLTSLERLPAWARETLAAHADDARHADHDWERLARARTGDALWDAAQRSLLVHGELHNNLRMTWGKAFLGWSASPQRALATMVDLNHRYALDGSDPNSWGGLLYCLGLFDRPFTPEQPIFGTVRGRSTKAHAERLDLPRYVARTGKRPRGAVNAVAVVGAGISGLAAARALADNGVAVTVLERGRGVGGRAAHRRRDGLAFDHGAQYFTGRDPRFARHVASWVHAGAVAPWAGRIVSLDRTDAPDDTSPLVRYVGVPGMNAVARHLALGLDVRLECTVDAARRVDGAWWLATGDDRPLGPFDALVLAVPPEQAARLVDLPASPQGEPPPTSLPCWCAMAAFDVPLPVDFDGAFVNGGSLSWVARDSSKPGRPPGERWTLHATPEWSAPRLDEARDDVARALLAHCFKTLAVTPQEPAYLSAHRWSFARPDAERALQCLWDAHRALALCGDWCLGGRMEGAYLSGAAAAGRVLGAAVYQGIG